MLARNEMVLGERYKIVSPLGAGGMANVYRARDLKLQREVAIKILKDDLIADPSFRASFLQEARSAANLAHPNIVTIYDFGHDPQRYFIVMEYIDGTDLKSLIRRRGQLSIKQSLDSMIQICAGVGYAHRAGLVHCDLKPQNILVTADGRVKITDFGISRALATIHPEERFEIVWGSPKYFAPEQAAGMPPSPSSDVYALGIILFEMLTGKVPFEAENAARLAELHQTSPPPPPRELNPMISPTLELIILKVLSKEPSARYRTADQFGHVLQDFLNQGEDVEIQEAPAAMESLPYPLDREPGNELPLVIEQVDWIAVFLGLFALLAVGGLIPLWLWACLLYPSCPLIP